MPIPALIPVSVKDKLPEKQGEYLTDIGMLIIRFSLINDDKYWENKFNDERCFPTVWYKEKLMYTEEEYNEALTTKELPDECPDGWGEIKFCYRRNSDCQHLKCKQCI